MLTHLKKLWHKLKLHLHSKRLHHKIKHGKAPRGRT